MYRYMPWSKRPVVNPGQPHDDFVVLDMPVPRSPSPTIIPPPEIVADHDDPEQETPPPPLDYWETIYTVGMIYMKIAVNTVKKYWNEFRTFVINQIGYTVAP